MSTQLRAVALVWVGGAIGTGLRHLVSVAQPSILLFPTAISLPASLPLGTLAVNLLGAFCLALLVSRTPSERLRLLVGTGLLGGFTTYSALALETVELVRHDAVGWALSYALGTVTIGGLATLAGLRLGGRGPGPPS